MFEHAIDGSTTCVCTTCITAEGLTPDGSYSCICLRCRPDRTEMVEWAEVELAEIAYDMAQEERAIYRGMTEQEFIDAPEWRSTIDQRPFYDAPDTCDDYVSDGPFCCICASCVEASEPHHIMSPEVQSQPFWRLKSLWARVRHWFR